MDLRPRLVFLVALAFLLVPLGANVSAGLASANLGAVLNVSPKVAVPNQTVTVFGTGFSLATTGGGRLLSGAHQITGQGASVISIDGNTLIAPNISYPIDFDPIGNWAANITVPLSPEIVAAGSVRITAVDDQGITQTTQLSIKFPSISLDPESSGRGASLSVTGEGFPASNTATAPDVQVSISYAGTFLKTVSPDYLGRLEATIQMPAATAYGSTNIVRASLIGYNRVVIAIHTVSGAAITVSPTAGKPGGQMTISGENFPSFAAVTSIRAGNILVSGSPAPVTDITGRFVSAFAIPLFSEGVQTITATAGGITAVSSFTVLGGLAVVLPTPTPQPSMDPISALSALSLRDNLIRVWNFDNSTKDWTFFDPRPAFATANSIRIMSPGRVYWLRLNRDQFVLLNGKSRPLLEGWNLVTW